MTADENSALTAAIKNTIRTPKSRRVTTNSSGIGDSQVTNATYGGITNTPYFGGDHINLSKPEPTTMSQIDAYDNIHMKDMDLHIQPTHNGYALTFIQDGNKMFYAFPDMEELIKFIKDDLGMMNLTDKEVAENV